MADDPVCIVGLGASTPIGRNAWSSAAAVRAGICGFTQHPYMSDSGGEPVHAAIAPWLDIDLSGVDRFEALLLPAIDQALTPLMEGPAGALRIGLALGLPAQRPGVAADLPESLMTKVRRNNRQPFTTMAVFSNGHAAGLLALVSAMKDVAQGTVDACIVAGVDSYIDPDAIEWLEDCDQLHGAGPLNNAWGFVPGEGSGALLLMRIENAARLRLAPLARVLGAGHAFEPRRIKTDTICVGEGLTKAFRAALQNLPIGIKVTDIYCDLNGEPYRADEFGFAALRTKDNFQAISAFVAPADCWGDVAAAGAPLHLMLAAIAGAKSYARGSVAFAWGSAEGGERVAALLDVCWSG